jgi:hypothetical protein
MVIDDRLPKRVLVVIVVERSGCLELFELIVSYWQTLLAIEALQIVTKGFADRVSGLARYS